MITKAFSLDDNFSILIEREETREKGPNKIERRIYKKDNILHQHQLMATYLEDRCIWIFPSKTIENEFWKLSKQYSGIIKNNVFKPMPFVYEITLERKFSCFKRRINVIITRTLNKLKY